MGSNGALSIEEIPSYVADRFDPSASFDADGEFNLADSIDYRPAGMLLTNAPDCRCISQQNISSISDYPFSYGKTHLKELGSCVRTCKNRF